MSAASAASNPGGALLAASITCERLGTQGLSLASLLHDSAQQSQLFVAPHLANETIPMKNHPRHSSGDKLPAMLIRAAQPWLGQPVPQLPLRSKLSHAERADA